MVCYARACDWEIAGVGFRLFVSGLRPRANVVILSPLAAAFWPRNVYAEGIESNPGLMKARASGKLSSRFMRKVSS